MPIGNLTERRSHRYQQAQRNLHSCNLGMAYVISRYNGMPQYQNFWWTSGPTPPKKYRRKQILFLLIWIFNVKFHCRILTMKSRVRLHKDKMYSVIWAKIRSAAVPLYYLIALSRLASRRSEFLQIEELCPENHHWLSNQGRRTRSWSKSSKSKVPRRPAGKS